MLVLSATPIPRTLALVIYGDLDVSVIDQLPPGRQKVDTFALGESYRPRVNAFLRKQVQEGHQVFIVCPLVGDGDTLPDERKAVTAYAKKLQEETFPDLRVSVLHGKMKPKEKEKVMETFAAGESDILVSTTVVEVGVDVPNATCMVVENAERFGLSQLHQLRGRVGRGQAKSYCILLSEHPSEETRRRLKVMTRTNNGFEISQEDLAAAWPRRLLRPAPARPAYPENCGSGLRYAAAGGGPVCRQSTAAPGRGSLPAGAPPPAGACPGAVPRYRRLHELMRINEEEGGAKKALPSSCHLLHPNAARKPPP